MKRVWINNRFSFLVSTYKDYGGCCGSFLSNSLSGLYNLVTHAYNLSQESIMFPCFFSLYILYEIYIQDACCIKYTQPRFLNFSSLGRHCSHLYCRVNLPCKERVLKCPERSQFSFFCR